MPSYKPFIYKHCLNSGIVIDSRKKLHCISIGLHFSIIKVNIAILHQIIFVVNSFYIITGKY